jgi:sporulation protein YlmC with PRC-barrel domain
MLKTKSMLLAALAVGLYGAAAVAETQYRAETGAQTGAHTGAQTGMDHDQKAAKAPVKKASDLMGKTVRDQQGEDLGEIEDFALDLEQGKLNYVVLSTGGLMEQRLVGISADELQAATDDDVYIARVSQQEIEQAQALPDENWPSQPTVASGAQPQRDTELAPFEGRETQRDTQYDTQREGQTGTQTGAQPGQRTGDVQTGMDRDHQQMHGVRKASELMGKTVRDQQGEDLGKIEDFALDLQQGELHYVVIDTGGFMSQRLIGIAADDLRQAPDDEDAFIANVTQQQVEQAQELPDENWPSQPTVGSAAQREGEFAPFEQQQRDQEWQQDQQEQQQY